MGVVLDVAVALARRADFVGAFFKRHRVLTIEAVAKLEDLGRAFVDFVEKALKLIELVAIKNFHVRRRIVSVGNKLIDRQLAISASGLGGGMEGFDRLADDAQF